MIGMNRLERRVQTLERNTAVSALANRSDEELRTDLGTTLAAMGDAVPQEAIEAFGSADWAALVRALEKMRYD